MDHLYQDPHQPGGRFFLHYGDMTDATNLIRIIQETQPDEIYNLAAQSHVQVSFETPEYTANADALGTLRLLEAIRILGMEKTCRFYQASTSELFGNADGGAPARDHAVLAAQSLCGGEALRLLDHGELPGGLRAARLQRHPLQPREPHPRRDLRQPQDHPGGGADRPGPAGRALPGQPRRPPGLGPCPRLRAGDAPHASSRRQPDDYVIATGEQHSVREFVTRAFAEVGIEVVFRGEGLDEVGVVAGVEATQLAKACNGYGPAARNETAKSIMPGQILVRIDPRYFRPTEVQSLLGDASKARRQLGWEPTVTFTDLLREMIAADLTDAQKYDCIQLSGLPVTHRHDS